MHPAIQSSPRETTIRQRREASATLCAAVRRGIVERGPCADAGEGRCARGTIHGHHEDYSKPLDVVWLCARHHMLRHSRGVPGLGAALDRGPSRLTPEDEEALDALAAAGPPERSPLHRSTQLPQLDDESIDTLAAIFRRESNNQRRSEA